MSTIARQIALETLLEWDRSPAFARDIMVRIGAPRISDARDAALTQNLVYTTLRHLSLLDHWITQLCDAPQLDDDVRWILRLGLAQLLILDLAPHAAVNETVKLAPHAGGLVNAVLRRAQRESHPLLEEIPTLPLPVRCSHPEWLVKRWIAQFGEQKATALCEWNQEPAPSYIRINKLHPQPPTEMELRDIRARAARGFFEVPQPPRDWLAEGRCYVQDPSTATSCRLLDPQPGETVLDACAAPGGKTAMLAELMQNQGRIYAADAAAARIPRLQENLRRMRVANARVFEHDWLSEKAPSWGAVRFDRILADVPCSNTGVMRRRIDVRWRLGPRDFPDMAATQSRILRALLPLLKSGGSLVYSTCSLDSEENEQVVEAVLLDTPGFTMTQVRTSLPWRDGVDGAFAACIVRNP